MFSALVADHDGRYGENPQPFTFSLSVRQMLLSHRRTIFELLPRFLKELGMDPTIRHPFRDNWKTKL
ncbi:hypothetical protein OHD60_11465 [Escherichia coli]|nr:hypothetical protein [Escherichia coli]